MMQKYLQKHLWRSVYSLGAIAFTSGFVLMAFELVAARMLAPSIGNSVYVWTSVIGVIMAALSLGYYLGGKMADRRHSRTDVAMLCFVAALYMASVMYLFAPVMSMVTSWFGDQRLQGIIVALVLFAPTSVLLGMMSPYLAKLSITSLQTSGQTVATLSAINSIGSIAGTFVAGFLLFGMIGSRETLVVLIGVLVVSGWLLPSKERLREKITVTVVLGGVMVLSLFHSSQQVVDTPTASYRIVTYQNDDTRTVRGILAGPNGVQSGIYPDQPNELVFWYTKELARVVAAAPKKERMLVLGGGTYTLPRHLAATYPTSQIDVVEIDPVMTDIARQHFLYDDPTNITLHYTDARVFVNEVTAQYDVILVDVYNDASVPFSLLTHEYGQRVKKLLAKDGVVVVNAIAAAKGACQPLYDAINGAYSDVSTLHYERFQNNASTRGNMILAYSKTPLALPEYAKVHTNSQQRYTDNFMPAEALQQRCQA